MVAVSVMVLRRTDPTRKRPFRTPAVFVVAPLAIIGCVVLYLSLPLTAKLVLPIWGLIGLVIYFGYSRSRSHVGRGIVDVVDDPSVAATELGIPLEDISTGAGHKDMRLTRRVYTGILNGPLQRMSERMEGRFSGWPVVPESVPDDKANH